MTTVTLAKLRRNGTVEFDPYEVEGRLSPSGRWVSYKYDKPYTKKQFFAVAHVRTGFDMPRDDMTATRARNLALALDEISTPALDAAPFGQLAETEDELSDLRKIRDRLTQFRAEERAQ